MSQIPADVVLVATGLQHEPWVIWMVVAAFGVAGVFAYIQMRS